MTFRKLFPALLLLAALVMGCEEQIQETPAEPVAVTKLVTPKNNLTVNIGGIYSELVFEWNATEWTGKGEVKYEVLFDALGGNFTAPAATFTTTETQFSLTKDDAWQIYNALKESGQEHAIVSWKVIAISPMEDSEERIVFQGSRNLILDGTLNPAIVDYLNTPVENTNINLLRYEDNLTFSWGAARWDGEGTVNYQLMFWIAEDESTEPVKTFGPVEDVQISLSKEQLAEILATAPGEGSKTVTFNWSVKSSAGDKSWNSTAMHSLVLSNDPSTAFVAGEILYLGVDSEEAGRQLLYVTDDYYRDTDILENTFPSAGEGEYGYYEIFTALEAGKKYYFYTGTSEQPEMYIKGSELLIVESAEEASATVQKSGTYRIRINPNTRQVGLALVKSVKIRRAWDSAMTELEYKGNGTWSTSRYNVNCILSNGTDDRYRFTMALTNVDGTGETEQHFSQEITNDFRPTKDSQESYWHLQPTRYAQWTNVWKYPNWLVDEGDMDKWFCDVNLYLNTEKAHYTHEFVNEFEWGDSDFFINGYTLRIGGEGSEAGQKCTYVGAGYYDTSKGDFKDIHQPINGAYYEIYTRIEANKPFYFYSDEKADNIWYFKGSEFTEVASAEAAQHTVSKTAIYRVRINLSTKEVLFAEVTGVHYDYSWDAARDAELTYRGKGVWKVENHHINPAQVSWSNFGERRYKFYMTYAGVSTKQGLGNLGNTELMPDTGTDAAYWNLSLITLGDWNAPFKLPRWVLDSEKIDRYCSDITVYMNDDRGHYTHEFSNTTVKDAAQEEPVEPAGLEDIYIAVPGTPEDGQKMTYIDEGYYVTTNCNDSWKDRFDGEGWGTSGYYEVFTQLNPGDTYYFYTLDKDGNKARFFKYGNGTYTEVNSAAEAAVSADAGKIYRFRMKPDNKKMTMVEVEWVVLRYTYNNGSDYKESTLTYAGKGKWTYDYYSNDLIGGEKRYRFLIKYPNYSAQGLSQNDSSKSHSDDEYYHVHLSYTGWNTRVFTYPDAIINGTTASCTKVNLYMNSDLGHYTHEFVK